MRRWWGPSAVALVLWVCGPLAKAQSSDFVAPSKAREAGACEGPFDPSSSLSFSAVRRVSLTLAPSFSPYYRIVYAWSKQGEWMLSSTDAYWPPPIPKMTESSLMDGDEDRAWISSLNTAIAAGCRVECDTEPKRLAVGSGWLRVETMKGGDALCVAFDEGDRTARFSKPLSALWAFAPSIPPVDRWSHPFWLQEHSGMLQLRIEGTAEVSIDGDLLGRVNGTKSLRVRAGERELVLTPVDGGAVRHVRVDVYPHQTSILRISVREDAD